ADIAIKDLPLVIVDLLNDAVTHAQRATPSCQLHFSRCGWVEHPLELGVELSCAHLSACRWRKYLYLSHRVNTVLGQVLAHQILDALCSQLRLWRFKPQAVRLGELRGRHQTRKLAGVDAV